MIFIYCAVCVSIFMTSSLGVAVSLLSIQGGLNLCPFDYTAGVVSGNRLSTPVGWP